ncbi:hypothetical protein D9M68_825570 [compost metagenome]
MASRKRITTGRLCSRMQKLRQTMRQTWMLSGMRICLIRKAELIIEFAPSVMTVETYCQSTRPTPR